MPLPFAGVAGRRRGKWFAAAGRPVRELPVARIDLCCVACCVDRIGLHSTAYILSPLARRNRTSAERPQHDKSYQPHSKSVARKGVWVQVPPPVLDSYRGNGRREEASEPPVRG